jgi:hypothetical protein
MNHEFTYYVAAFMAAFGAALIVYIAFLAVRYVVRDTLEVLVRGLFAPLLMLAIEPVRAFKRQLEFNRETVSAKQESSKNIRLATAKRVRVGEALMETPAYARKEMSVGYPMSRELLTKPKFIVYRQPESSENLDLESMAKAIA